MTLESFERLVPPVLCNAVRDVRVVERGPFLVTAFYLAIPWSVAMSQNVMHITPRMEPLEHSQVVEHAFKRVT
jgi:hypothetical protein